MMIMIMIIILTTAMMMMMMTTTTTMVIMMTMGFQDNYDNGFLGIFGFLFGFLGCRREEKPPALSSASKLQRPRGCLQGEHDDDHDDYDEDHDDDHNDYDEDHDDDCDDHDGGDDDKKEDIDKFIVTRRRAKLNTFSIS